MSSTTSTEVAAVGQAASRAGLLRECLSFRLGDEEYGIDILRVQEIRGYERPTRIAGAQEFVSGVLNLRGVIVPIIDLRVLFGIEAHFDAITVTVVLNVSGRTVGTVVDSVSDVLDLTPEQIKPAPEFNSAVDTAHVTGIGSVRQGERERMLILLDIEQLMASANLGLIPESVS